MIWVFWSIAAIFAVVLFAYISSEIRYRRFVADFRETALDDHHITVWEREVLYDHAERGDFDV